MKTRIQRAVIFFVPAVICLQIGYITLTAKQPVVLRDRKQEVVEVRDLTDTYRIVSVSAFVAGVVLMLVAIHRFATSGNTASLKTPGEPMRGWWWSFVNVILISSAVWGGYKDTKPENLVHTNPDALLCALTLLITLFFAFGTLYWSKAKRFERPGLDRFPLNWSGDPLQALFITTLWSLGLFAGSLAHAFSSGVAGVWTSISFACLAIGLTIGQLLGYWFLRDRLTGV